MIGRGCLSVLRDGYVVSFDSLSCISEYSAIMHLCFSGALLRLNFLVNVEHQGNDSIALSNVTMYRIH